MSALTVTLGADISSLTRAMAGATAVVSATAKRMSKVTGQGLSGLGKGGSAALGKGFALSGLALKAGIGAALAGGAAAVGAGVKAVSQAADFEQTKVAFTTLIGSASKAEEVLGRLRKFADETPFEFPEIADAGRKLIAFGEDANTMPDTLRRIGDVSAGIQAPINEIAEIYGKCRVQGRLFAEDVNQLTGRGIPVIQELAKQFHISESGVKKLVESGSVGFPQIEKAFKDMTDKGGKFHGMMDEQSKTTKGLFSTLADAVNGVFREFGNPLNDAIRPLVAGAIDLVGKLTPLAVDAGVAVKNAINFMLAAFQSGLVTELVSTSLQYGFEEAINYLINGLRMSVTYFFALIGNGGMWSGLASILIGVAEMFGAALMNAFRYPMEIFQARMLSWFTRFKNWWSKNGPIDGDHTTYQTDPDKILEILHKHNTEEDLPGGLLVDAKERIAAGLPGVIAASKAAAATAREFGTDDFIDTSGMKDTFDKVIQQIMDAMPAPDGSKKPDDPGYTPPTPQKGDDMPTKLEPIVSSLGKVGGGGYSPGGALDAQRENNRLTGRTNELLTDLNKGVEKLGARQKAAFG